jgi:hypothetical protein
MTDCFPGRQNLRGPDPLFFDLDVSRHLRYSRYITGHTSAGNSLRLSPEVTAVSEVRGNFS